MKKLLEIRISILLAILLLPVCAKAVPITIAITGNVTSIGGSVGSIPDTIYAGVSFTGTYTYESSTVDSGNGHHLHNSPYGISLSLGGYEFKTAPNHVGQFDMWIINDGVGNGIKDYYIVRSEYENVSIPSVGFTTNYIRWDLQDSTYAALSSTALPTIAPVLTDWNYNVLTISGSDVLDYGLLIQGTVTQAELVPEPATSTFLLTMSVFLFRRRR